VLGLHDDLCACSEWVSLWVKVLWLLGALLSFHLKLYQFCFYPRRFCYFSVIGFWKIYKYSEIKLPILGNIMKCPINSMQYLNILSVYGDDSVIHPSMTAECDL